MMRALIVGILVLGSVLGAAAGGLLTGPQLAQRIGWVLFVPLTLAAIVGPSAFLHLAHRRPSTTAFLLPSWGFFTFFLLSLSIAFLDSRWKAAAPMGPMAITLAAWMAQNGLFLLESSGRRPSGQRNSARRFVMIRSLPMILAPALAIVVVLAGARLVGLAPVLASLAIVLSLSLVLQAGCVEAQTYCLTRLGDLQPTNLTAALATVYNRTGVRFGSVTFLSASLTTEFICEVRWRVAEPPSLVVSQAVLEILDDTELLAVLCHEAGHVARHHLGWRIFTSAVTTYGGALLVYAVSATMSQMSVLRSPILQAMLCLVVVLFARMLIEMWISRRCEAEADRYAASFAGPAPLSRALRKATSWIEHGHLDLSIWLSHESLPRRLRRLAALEFEVGTA